MHSAIIDEELELAEKIRPSVFALHARRNSGGDAGQRGQRGQTPAGQTAGAGDRAQGLLQTVCIACHNLNRVQTKNLAQSDWQIIVDRMKGKGAELSDEDFSGLIEYLAKT